MSIASVVQVIAAILAVAALVVACAAIFIVGQVAYPLGATTENHADPREVDRRRRQLHSGIRLTVVALILIVTAALSGWWPKT